MRKPRTIPISIEKAIFTGIIDYFNISEEWLTKQHNITIRKDKDIVDTTISRLRKISGYLKIPVSLFFTSKLPQFQDPPKDYRSQRSKFTKNTINAFRDAYYYQEILNDLTNNPLLIKQKYSIQDDPISAGDEISNLINFENLRHKSYRNTGSLLRYLRYKLENYNIFTFKAEFPVEETRGFSLSETNHPIIFINIHDKDVAKIFTILHELGHILLGEPGISEPSSYIFKTGNPVEKWCNQFAASITIPQEKIIKISFHAQEDIGIKINNLSKELLVSKHSLAYALLKINKINKQTYQEYISRPYVPNKGKISTVGFKIPRENIITSRKGKKFTQTVMDAYRSKIFSQSEVREILKINENDKAFQTLLEL